MLWKRVGMYLYAFFSSRVINKEWPRSIVEDSFWCHSSITIIQHMLARVHTCNYSGQWWDGIRYICSWFWIGTDQWAQAVNAYYTTSWFYSYHHYEDLSVYWKGWKFNEQICKWMKKGCKLLWPLTTWKLRAKVLTIWNKQTLLQS